MDQLDHLFDVLIEETERVRIGEHHADDSVVTGSFESLQVHIAALIGWDGDHAQAHHADGGGVGPMGSIRDEHLLALVIAARFVIGAHHEHAGEFSVCAGGRLQGHCSKACDLFQPFLQLVHQRQVALDSLDRLEGMGVEEAGQAGSVFIDLGVVLHRARAERDNSHCPRCS